MQIYYAWWINSILQNQQMIDLLEDSHASCSKKKPVFRYINNFPRDVCTTILLDHVSFSLAEYLWLEITTKEKSLMESWDREESYKDNALWIMEFRLISWIAETRDDCGNKFLK